MKKTAMVLVFAIIFTCFGSTVTMAESSHNPYTGLEMTHYDEIVNANSMNTSNPAGFVANVKTNQYILFKNVDFGKTGAIGVSVYAATAADYAGGTVTVRLDDPKGTPVASVTTLNSGWNTPVELYADLAHTVKGVHDVYVTNETLVSNLFRAVFLESGFSQGDVAIYTEDRVFSDIEGNKYENDIYTLYSLGLLEGFDDGIYEPEFGVSRAEFAQVMFRILNDGTYAATEQIFADVAYEKNEEVFNAVAYLAEQGVVSVPEDKCFNPYQYITLTDAMVMCVRALGYKTIAEFKGGYPGGYLAIATQERLLSGINSEEYLRRGAMAALVYNFLNADYLDIETISSNGDIEYRNETGILFKTHGINKGVGIVSANYHTGLDIPEGTSDGGVVIIDGKTYKVGESPASALLGYKTNFFYKEDDGVRTILYIRPVENLKKTEYDTAKGVEISSFTENALRYSTPDGKERELRFSENTRFIYNNKAVDASLSSILDSGIFRGKITHIDNNDGIDVVLIEQYRNIIIQSINSKTLAVTDMLSGNSYDLNENKNDVYVFNGDRASSPLKIKEGSLLTVYASKNVSGRKYVRCLIENSNVMGKVSYKTKDAVVINGVEYGISPECEQDINVGLSAEFYINSFGEIVTFELAKELEGNVAVILGYRTEAKGAFDNTQEIRVFTKGNNAVNISLAENVVIDGVMCKTFDETLNGKGVFAGLKNVGTATLVRYKTNSLGEINMLDTHLSGTNDSNDIIKRITDNGVSRVQCFQYSSIYVNNDTKIIIPYADDQGIFTIWEKDNYDSLVYSEQFVAPDPNSQSTIFNADIYSVGSENNIANYIIWHGKSADQATTKPLIFDSLEVSLNEDEEQVYNLNFINSNSSQTYFVKERALAENSILKARVDNLQKGDAVRVRADDQNYVSELTFECYNDLKAVRNGISARVSKDAPFASIDKINFDNRCVYGKVVDKFDGFIKIEYNDGGLTYYDYIKVPGNAIIVYDYNGGREILENMVPVSDLELNKDYVVAITMGRFPWLVIKYNHPDI